MVAEGDEDAQQLAATLSLMNANGASPLEIERELSAYFPPIEDKLVKRLVEIITAPRAETVH